MASPMDIERSTVGDITILRFDGEFDDVELPTIERRMDALLEDAPTRLAINLEKAAFLGAGTVLQLIRTAERLIKREGELVLAEPNRFFEETIKALRLARIFKVFPSEQEAIYYLRGDDFEDGAGTPARIHPYYPTGSARAMPDDTDELRA